MRKDVEDFLKYCTQNITAAGGTHFKLAQEYMANLPLIYSHDIEFRLLFDYYFSPQGIRIPANQIHELFFFQHLLCQSLCKHYDLNYQFWQFFVFHAIANTKGKQLLEVGGSLPNEMIFDLFGVEQYINTESPDYIQAESGSSCSEKHGRHAKKQTIFMNAENIHEEIQDNSIDLIFSVACFEHINNLESALASCYKIQKDKGHLYSYFAPIYSYLVDGHHHVIPSHPALSKTPLGFHLLNHNDQRKYLEISGLNNPREIQEFLGAVNFDRIPNRMYYEDYTRILTESQYWVIRLDDVSNHNLSKQHPSEVARVRISNPEIKNLHSMGFRVLLQK